MTMMKTMAMAAALAGMAGLATPGIAQGADFNLTYHVERTPAARMSIERCGQIVAQTARQAGVVMEAQSFPGQLVILKGGRRGAGALVVQCIAVGGTTVSVVQGIDYRAAKGALGMLADRVFATIKQGVKQAAG